MQLGVFTPDGVQSAARLTQLMLEANPKHIALKTDFKNAFNNIPRQLVLQQLFQHPDLSNFFNMIHWTYATPSFQFFRGSEGVAAVVKSCQGVRQGCVFGSLGFAIATLSMFTQIRDKDPNILVVAILDDLCLSGDTQAVFGAFDKLQQLANDHNIPIQPEKCEVLAPQKRVDSFDQLARERRLKISKDNLPLLGTVVGRDTQAQRSWVRDSLTLWQRPLQLLQHLPSQLALLIARTIGTAKVNHIARALPPHTTLGALEQHDRAVQRCVQQRLDLNFEGFSQFVFNQPLSRGGIGFVPSASRALPAFVASVASTLHHIHRTPLRNSDLANLPTLQAVQTALNKLDDEKVTVEDLPQELPAFIKKFRTHFPPESLQSRINDQRQHEARGKNLVQFRNNKTLICQWESRQTPFASAALKAYTLSSEFVLTDEEVRFMVAHATANNTQRNGFPLLVWYSTRSQPLHVLWTQRALQAQPPPESLRRTSERARMHHRAEPPRKCSRLSEDARTGCCILLWRWLCHRDGHHCRQSNSPIVCSTVGAPCQRQRSLLNRTQEEEQIRGESKHARQEFPDTWL